MRALEEKVSLAERTVRVEEEASQRRVEAAREDDAGAEKPKASEEIVIEEISIDGMCGVY